MKIGIIFNDTHIAGALERYMRFVLDFAEFERASFSDPYSRKQLFKVSTDSDFLVIDALTKNRPEGFQIAQEIEKKVLLVFYFDEIKDHGSFWLILPDELSRLPQKILAFISEPIPQLQDYKNLEQRYPILDKTHHPPDHHNTFPYRQKDDKKEKNGTKYSA